MFESTGLVQGQFKINSGLVHSQYIASDNVKSMIISEPITLSNIKTLVMERLGKVSTRRAGSQPRGLLVFG